MKPIKFTIPLIPVTKKNSQQIFYQNVNGKRRPFITPSKKYKEYEKEASWFVPHTEIDYPVNVKSIFYMPTRRKADLSNLIEALHDVMVKCRCLLDDNSNIVFSVDGSRVYYDKENPRTEVTITEAVGVKCD